MADFREVSIALLQVLVEVNREREEVIAQNSALRDVVEQALMEARRLEGLLRQAHGQEQALADGLHQQHQQNAFLQQFAKPAAEPTGGYGASGDAISWYDIVSRWRAKLHGSAPSPLSIFTPSLTMGSHE